MKLRGLARALTADAGFADALDLVRQRADNWGEPAWVDVRGAPGIRPALLASMARAAVEAGPRTGLDQQGAAIPPVVAITASTAQAQELAQAAAAFMERDQIAVLPAWETLPHERLSPRADTLAHRVAVFHRLAHPDPVGAHGPIHLLTVPIRSILQPVVQGLGDLPVVAVRPGDQAPIEDLAAALIDAAYERVDMVTRRGEFAVRGGILDVFAPTDDHPLRLDFFGDEVEEVRYFSVADQRSADLAPDGLWAPACRELRLTPQVRERAQEIQDQLPGAREMLTQIAQGIAVEGMESLTPVLAHAMVPVLDCLPKGSTLVFVEPERLRRRAEDLAATTQEFLHAAWEAAAIGGNSPIDLSAASFLTLPELRDQARAVGCGWWNLHPPGFTGEVREDTETCEIAATPPPVFRGNVAGAIKQLREWIKAGWLVVLTTQGHGPAKRLVERLSEHGVAARLTEDLAADAERTLVYVTTASGDGFVMEDLRIAVLSEGDLTGRAGASTRDMRRMPARRKATVDPLQLQAGELVVHEQHGVGRFLELVERTVGTGANKATREYLVLEYAPSKRGQPGDRWYVPTDSLDQLTKYVGGENPGLSRLGGSDWAATKTRARKAVKEIAGELIRLYAARMATPGFAFSADTPWQRELEDAFAYVETPDQLVTIDEVKGDMERPVPMDRLVCGDVGYGKTEIAVRAAFKAVQDGKQVAVLAPTTLLVQQHMETFTDRYSPFPVVVKPLSRFQSAKESTKTKEDLASGAVDVVIGTHSLISGNIRFKDLGLVIVDEEQRFGVEHKETLKAVRASVDVLSMSATPIPRTLEMAVSGIREMSTLMTPPEERHPVLTYVGAATDGQKVAAIRRELLRDGQVFYVHNRVRGIARVAAHLGELLPDARIAVAHGQMKEHTLEQVIIDFWEKKYDVLVCTTIIETGLDIGNANTLIVDNADKFGLSQLHQLRGRVGRGRERAYAYFLYPPDHAITETAHDRLATIAAQSDLGAGMAVALKDLEIRGAGNLLGQQQSGHIAGVGFDLYLRMIQDAVAESKGEEPPQAVEVTVELPIDAHIPHSYIDTERLRLEAYTKMAGANTPEARTALRDELEDRYGAIPEEVENLFALARLRGQARCGGITEITMQSRYLRLHPVELPESKQLWLKRVFRGAIIKPATRTVLVPPPRAATLGGPAPTGMEVVQWATQLVTDMCSLEPAEQFAGQPS
jgi:transcription-repair coupling factor (superfamily II helicase)